MNILITSYDMNPQYVFGDKRVSLTLAKEWKRRGHNVFFLCYCPSSCRLKEVEGIEFMFFPDNDIVSSDKNLSFFHHVIETRKVQIILHQHAKIESFNKLCFALDTKAKIISVIHFDIEHEKKVLAHFFFAKMRNGKNIIKWLLDLIRYFKYLIYTKREVNLRLKQLYTEIYLKSNKVALLSDSFKESFMKYVDYADAGKLIAINNPVLPILFKDGEVSKEKTVLWIGRLGYEKGLDKMLFIWKEMNRSHPDWQLKILGSGDWKYWNEMISRYNIQNAEVVGFCNPTDYYAKASIICMTSIAEGWGMVLVEAQQYGCVPIAYRSYAALDDIITDGENGFCVKAFDQKEYVKKLRKLMDDSELRHRMSISGIKSVERYNVEHIGALWIDNFERMLQLDKP